MALYIGQKCNKSEAVWHETLEYTHCPWPW